MKIVVRFPSKMFVLVLLVLVSMFDSFDAAPSSSSRSARQQVDKDKDLVIDVSPFFKMNLHREPLTTILDINVLSGLVKVGYDRLPGRKPNVAVQVFGLGTTRNQADTPTEEFPPITNDDGNIKYV